MRGLYELFLQDVAVYHTLLSKLNPQESSSQAERKECVLCLGVLLAHSTTLSRLFTRSLSTLTQLHQIAPRVTLYLLGECQVEPR